MRAATSLQIFIVDDDPFCLAVYEQQLRNLGFQNITVFDNGEACINSITPATAVVFLDYNMPSLNGMEVLKQLKEVNPDIYVVLLSGQDDIEVAVEALQNGAFDYIVKANNDHGRIEQVLDRIHTARELLILNRNSVVF